MAATLTRGKTFGATEEVTNAKLHSLVDSGTIANLDQTNLVASSGLAIRSTSAPSDTDALWVDTNVTPPHIKKHDGSNWVDAAGAKGADVASAAALTLGNDGNYFDITGTTTITSITAKAAGSVIRLQFDGVLTVTDGSNLKIAGDFITAAESTMVLVCDGTNYFELSRSPGAATQAQMETATDNGVFATPGRVNFHPGVAKAWGVFDGSGTPTFSVRHNLDATITDGGVGDYTVAFTTNFSTADWVMAGSIQQTNNSTSAVSINNASTPTAEVVEIVSHREGAQIDSPRISVVFYGDQ